MTFVELISFCKVFSVALHLDSERILSRADLEIASEALKRMGGEAPYWDQYQRDAYKAMVDFTKRKLDEMI